MLLPLRVTETRSMLLSPRWKHQTPWPSQRRLKRTLGTLLRGISRSTVLLVGRQVVHTRNGAIVLAVAAVLFAFGSVMLARPFVRSWLTLSVAVPIAGVVGLLLLGVGAIVLALIVYVVLDSLDLPDFSRSARRRRRART